jgi:hypothetical protein
MRNALLGAGIGNLAEAFDEMCKAGIFLGHVDLSE